jgi:hypothetical protein
MRLRCGGRRKRLSAPEIALERMSSVGIAECPLRRGRHEWALGVEKMGFEGGCGHCHSYGPSVVGSRIRVRSSPGGEVAGIEVEHVGDRPGQDAEGLIAELA